MGAVDSSNRRKSGSPSSNGTQSLSISNSMEGERKRSHKKDRPTPKAKSKTRNVNCWRKYNVVCPYQWYTRNGVSLKDYSDATILANA